MIYYKRYTGKLLPQKTAEQPSWVQWTHHSEGKTHCEECLMLDGCWFQEENAPSCPHHPYCHCTLDPIPYAVVLMNTTSYSDYSKFDPYLFDPENTYRHGKNRAFESWGYPRKRELSRGTANCYQKSYHLGSEHSGNQSKIFL